MPIEAPPEDAAALAAWHAYVETSTPRDTQMQIFLAGWRAAKSQVEATAIHGARLQCSNTASCYADQWIAKKSAAAAGDVERKRLIALAVRKATEHVAGGCSIQDGIVNVRGFLPDLSEDDWSEVARLLYQQLESVQR